MNCTTTRRVDDREHGLVVLSTQDLRNDAVHGGQQSGIGDRQKAARRRGSSPSNVRSSVGRWCNSGCSSAVYLGEEDMTETVVPVPACREVLGKVAGRQRSGSQ